MIFALGVHIFLLYKKSCFSMFKKESECLPSKLYNSDYYVLSNVLFVFLVRLLSHLKLFSHFFYFKKSGMDSNSTRLSCGLHYYTKGHQCYGAQPGTKNCSPILFLNRSAASTILSLNGNRWEGRRTKISRCSPKQKTKKHTNKLGSRVPNDHWRDLLFACFHLPPLTQGLEQPKS